MSRDALERFRRSMVIGYEEWHEGTPYDLDALDALTDDERGEIEESLVARAGRNFRDVSRGAGSSLALASTR